MPRAPLKARVFRTDASIMARTLLSWFHSPRPSSSRIGSWCAGILALGFAGAYFASAYAVVFVLRIGPTSVSISEVNGWGVHTGDVLALPLAVMGMLTLAFGVACLAPERRPALVIRPLARR